MDPAPAISGNARGTIAPFLPGDSCLNSSTPSTISSPRRNTTNEPAIANEEMSTPKIPRRGFPINKKPSIIIKAMIVTFSAFITPVFDLRSSIMGMDPNISIMAKRTMNAAIISTKFTLIIIDSVFRPQM